MDRVADIRAPEARLLLWKLPDAVLFQVVTFVAPPTHRAAVLCHQMAPLSRDASQAILTKGDALWEIVLREDYGVRDYFHQGGSGKTESRRVCQRLRRSVMQRVKSAHQLIHDNTEIAFFYLSEMGSLARGGLTKAKLRGLLEEYGPIRTNNVVSSGGVFLVELCRARKVRESVILACVQEMVAAHGALVDNATRESERCRETALCVAAARGMPTVVKYLLQQGASPELRSSGRFRLHHVPKRTLARRHVRPLEFAQAMRTAEKQAGATDRSLSALDDCIQRLEKVTRKLAPADVD